MPHNTPNEFTVAKVTNGYIVVNGYPEDVGETYVYTSPEEIVKHFEQHLVDTKKQTKKSAPKEEEEETPAPAEKKKKEEDEPAPKGEKKQKRKRRTKAQIEADRKAAEEESEAEVEGSASDDGDLDVEDDDSEPVTASKLTLEDVREGISKLVLATNKANRDEAPDIGKKVGFSVLKKLGVKKISQIEDFDRAMELIEEAMP